MANFQVILATGSTINAQLGEASFGQQQIRNIEAESKVEAFLIAYRDFKNEDIDITTISIGDEGEVFNQLELQQIYDETGLILKPGYPKKGIQIHAIRQVDL